MVNDSASKNILNTLHAIIDKREDFFPYLSEPGKAVMGSVWKNGYEDFSENNVELQNLSPELHQVIQRQLFSLFTEAGYFLWMAEQLIQSKVLVESKATSIEQLGFKSDNIVISLDKYKMPQPTSQALLDFTRQVLSNNITKMYPGLNTGTTQKFKDNLQEALLKTATATYQVACAEAPFRKATT